MTTLSAANIRELLDGGETVWRLRMEQQPPPECSISYMLGDESWLPSERRSPLRYTWEAWHGPLFRSRPKKYLCGSHTSLSPYQVGDVVEVTGPPVLANEIWERTSGTLGTDEVVRPAWTTQVPDSCEATVTSVEAERDGDWFWMIGLKLTKPGGDSA